MQRKRIGEELREESGQSLVEFAIIAPVLILILMVSIELGWVVSNRINFDNMALVAVHANAKTKTYEAQRYMTNYIHDNYKRYDAAGLTVQVVTDVREYDYEEYVWKVNQKKFWEVPMYYRVLHTGLTVSYDLPYLTPFGKVLFHDADNFITLTANSVANRVLKNDSIVSKEGDGT